MDQKLSLQNIEKRTIMTDTIHLIIQLKVICDDSSSNPNICNVERGPFKKAQVLLAQKMHQIQTPNIPDILQEKKKKAYMN